MDKKLTKQQVTSVHVDEQAKTIISQEYVEGGAPMPVALRIAGHLLLGVVKIYWRQVKVCVCVCVPFVLFCVVFFFLRALFFFFFFFLFFTRGCVVSFE